MNKKNSQNTKKIKGNKSKRTASMKRNSENASKFPLKLTDISV